MLLPSWYLPSLMGVLFYFMIKTFFLKVCPHHLILLLVNLPSMHIFKFSCFLHFLLFWFFLLYSLKIPSLLPLVTNVCLNQCPSFCSVE
jgi:hypothetical protein